MITYVEGSADTLAAPKPVLTSVGYLFREQSLNYLWMGVNISMKLLCIFLEESK